MGLLHHGQPAVAPVRGIRRIGITSVLAALTVLAACGDSTSNRPPASAGGSLTRGNGSVVNLTLEAADGADIRSGGEAVLRASYDGDYESVTTRSVATIERNDDGQWDPVYIVMLEPAAKGRIFRADEEIPYGEVAFTLPLKKVIDLPAETGVFRLRMNFALRTEAGAPRAFEEGSVKFTLHS